VVSLNKEAKDALGLMKIDVFGSYLQSQAAFPERVREPQLAITISREVGAGGRMIAELVLTTNTKKRKKE